MDSWWGTTLKVFITGLLLAMIATFTWQSVEILNTQTVAESAAGAAASTTTNQLQAAQKAAGAALQNSTVDSLQNVSGVGEKASVSYQPSDPFSSIFKFLGVSDPNQKITMSSFADTASGSGLPNLSASVTLSYSILTGSSGPNLSLTATSSVSLDNTPYYIGIYDETTNTWLSYYNNGPDYSNGTGTTFSTSITSSFPSDTYVGVIGMFKSSNTLKTAVVVAKSSPLIVKLPTGPTYQWQSAYPDIWSWPYWYFGEFSIATDSEVVLEFQNAWPTTSGSDPMVIQSVVQNGQGLNFVGAGSTNYMPYYLTADTGDSVTVTWAYNVPGVATTSHTLMVAPPTGLSKWSFSFTTGNQYFTYLAYASTYSPTLTQLNVSLNYEGTTYTADMNAGGASSLDGYDYLVYEGNYFYNRNYQELYVGTSPVTLNGTATLTGGSTPIDLTCSITISGTSPTSGYCQQ